ncbi:MAG: AAA family ATPase [Bacteroidia bacterium]|nr:AAA family ATPase [Bacteroidia bacterium]
MFKQNLKPVILLAFANDKQDTSAGYLRGLTDERNGIRDVLAKAEEHGLCEVIVEPDISIKRIFDVFQNSSYRDRIAIFHYGGHADSYQLLLESQDGTTATAHTEGLVSFLSKQRGLQMVFLNGCSSQKQSEDLVKSGVPAVVGTSQKINDKVATGLAIRFYKGLAEGNTIERAWAESVDQVKTEKGTSQTRSMFWDEEEAVDAPSGKFPWDIYYNPEKTFAEAWNLPDAAKDPLFGLDIPAHYFRKLPASPFVGLRSFVQDEAAIFFGRGKEIRDLYSLLTVMQPVILLSGKAGVGKSSILQAGLIPRMEVYYTVRYTPRQSSGLVSTLTKVLDELCEKLSITPPPSKEEKSLKEKIAELRTAATGLSEFARQILENEIAKLNQYDRDIFSPAEQWRMIEQVTGKPLVIILDQIEESFSGTFYQKETITEEWKSFMQILTPIWGQEQNSPAGKIILSYREEHHSLTCEVFRENALPYAEMFLPAPDWEGIVQAVEGITIRPSTRNHYRLEIENRAESSLPKVLADDIIHDGGSPISPVLQVLLTEMWNRAIRENPRQPRFSVRAYQELNHSGAVMTAFFRQQLEKLKSWQGAVVDSGLILDLLFHHTTLMGTETYLHPDQLGEKYRGREENIWKIVSKCSDLYLLADQERRSTSVIHRLLAPVVISEYSVSVRPGQQAARILSSKIEEFRTGEKDIWLNDADLEIVESGLEGMRNLSTDEEKLLQTSREQKIRREKERKRVRIIRTVLVAVIFVFAVLAGWQWQVSVRNLKTAKSSQLAFIAKEIFKLDNTKAARIAYEAYSILTLKSSSTVTQTLSEIFHSQEKVPFYSAVFPHLENVNTAVFSPDGKNVLTASEDGFAKLWSLEGEMLADFSHDGYEVLEANFSPNGKQILTLTKYLVYLWEWDGTRIDSDSLAEGEIPHLKNYSTDGVRLVPAFFDHGEEPFFRLTDSLRGENIAVVPAISQQRILVIPPDQMLRWCDGQGNTIKDSLVSHALTTVFSPDEKQFLTVSFFPERDTSEIIIWDENARRVLTFPYKGEITHAIFSAEGNRLLTSSKDKTARLWDFRHKIAHRLPRQGAVKNAVFSPDGTKIATASFDRMARLWDAEGNLEESFAHEDVVSSVVFSPDGKHLLTACRDFHARIWTPGEANPVMLRNNDEVTVAVFSPEGSRILTGSIDYTARLWTADGIPVDSFTHEGEVNHAAFSPDGKKVLTVSRDLFTAYLWTDSKSAPILFRHPSEVNRAVFSPDGKYILTACGDSTARLWRTNGDSVNTFRLRETVSQVIFSPDGKRIFAGGKMLKIWNENGEPVDSLAHEAMVVSINFSPDGSQILTASQDQITRLWNVRGSLLAEYDKHKGFLVNSAVFSPDGTQILTAADDGYGIVWWTPHRIYEWLKSPSVYQLTPEEKDLFEITP